jgi:hypothetical protein
MRIFSHCRAGFPTPGDSQPCRCFPISTNSSTLNSAKPTSVCSGGKIVRSNVRAARAAILDSGVPTNIAPGANATGAITASAPSTTSPRPYCIGARDRCHTGFSPPFCCALPVRRGASRENWVSMSARAIAGAGGCAMPLCPMRCIASWNTHSAPLGWRPTYFPGGIFRTHRTPQQCYVVIV